MECRFVVGDKVTMVYSYLWKHRDAAGRVWTSRDFPNRSFPVFGDVYTVSYVGPFRGDAGDEGSSFPGLIFISLQELGGDCYGHRCFRKVFGSEAEEKEYLRRTIGDLGLGGELLPRRRRVVKTAPKETEKV